MGVIIIFKDKNNFWYLLSFSGKYKIFTIIGCILSGISAIFMIIPFIYIWQFLESLIIALPDLTRATNLEHYAIMAFTFAIAGILLYLIALLCTHLSAFHNESNIKKQTINHVLELPLGYFSEKTSGELVKKIDYDASQTEGFLAHQLPDLVGAFISPIIFVILLFSFDLLLGFLCLIPVIISLALFIPMFGGTSAMSMKKYMESLEKMNSEAVEYVRGIPVTKTFQQTIYSFERFYNSIKSYGKFVLDYSFSMQTPMTAFTTSLNGFFIVLIPAAILLVGSTVNKEFLLDLLFYIIFTPFCTVMINRIMMVSQAWYLAKISLSKLTSIIDEETLPEKEETQQPIDYSIEFDNVTFDYEEKHKDGHVLDNINLSIKENDKIALVGPSGSGKTTIATLISRFYDVSGGSVKIGGVDVRDMSQKDLLRNISFVFQNTVLFKDTILNNIKMAKPDASLYEVYEAVNAARCDEIIDKLPQGMQTVIGTKGVYLSGGEQQRIVLARAILKDAPIILLDEATALADPDNELEIQKALDVITEDKTVVMIAHRLSTIENVDKIYVINDGSIIEEGSHNDLLKKEGFYFNMWNEYNKSLTWNIKN